MVRCRHRNRHKRKGNILVLSAMLMVVLLAMLAFSLDVGYLYVARTELQRTADAAAMAGAWELVDANGLDGSSNATELATNARTFASTFASQNKILTAAPTVPNSNVTVGYMSNPFDPAVTLDVNSAQSPNAVRVLVQRTSGSNGTIPLFFGQFLGIQNVAMQAEATAALVGSIKGFQTPGDGGNLDLLPYALDVDTWDALMNGTGVDNFTYNPSTKTVTSGGDGIKEVNLFPQGTGSPGNRGTVDIGSSNNSTNDIARQIVHGISPDDLEYHGGKLELGSNGTLSLNGDTGISAGVKDEFESIKGQPRIIPIFSEVDSPGNNAQYTIVRFVGIRIVEVKLTGSMSNKRVMIQPANVIVRGGIRSPTSGTSKFVYSPVTLVR